MIKQFLLVTLWMLIGFGSLDAQVVTPGFEMQDLIKIGYAYREAPNLSFDIKFRYADSTAPTVDLEEIDGQYKMHNGRYWAIIDSTEMLQGYNYNLVVYHSDKMISVFKPKFTENQVLQVPVLDTTFDKYTDSIHISQLCDTARLMKIFFKPGFRYSGYEIRYHPHTYLVDSIRYYMKNNPQDDESGTSLIKISFCHYSKSAVPESYFNENKFIYKDDQFHSRAAYSDYHVFVDGNLK